MEILKLLKRILQNQLVIMCSLDEIRIKITKEPISMCANLPEAIRKTRNLVKEQA